MILPDFDIAISVTSELMRVLHVTDLYIDRVSYVTDL